jgi:hypothetical protein
MAFFFLFLAGGGWWWLVVAGWKINRIPGKFGEGEQS